jgi:uncharacterized protein with FMN-binding domain
MTAKTDDSETYVWGLKHGSYDDGTNHVTHVQVVLDIEGKIFKVYVAGNVVSGTTAEWDASKWLANSTEYTNKLKGKTLAQVQAMYGESGAASGSADVVTGATASSNRVLAAVIDALTPAAE